MQGFLHCVWPPKMHFWAIFLLNNGHNSAENDRTGKKFTFVLKTTYMKVFLKYQVNTRFPSLCLASGNGIFGSERRKNKKKKKKVGKSIGDPVRGRDAPINFYLVWLKLGTSFFRSHPLGFYKWVPTCMCFEHKAPYQPVQILQPILQLRTSVWLCSTRSEVLPLLPWLQDNITHVILNSPLQPVFC